nr:hypothetical protein [Oxalobacteraceae bacterium]
MSSKQFAISMLLATRGRTTALDRSIHSLMGLAHDPQQIQVMFAFDKDDQVGLDHWANNLRPWMDQHGYNYTAMKFDPLGYIRLHLYNNAMAKLAKGDWFVIWNDDAVMETQDWDKVILGYNSQFKLLAFHTHNDHPYSIFPIVPRKWYELLGYISPHPTQDGWLSQQAYMLDIWQRIPVWVTHDRFDLTGNNGDATFQNRAMLEGRPEDPTDFHSVQQMELRHRDCAKLAAYLHDQLGQDISFFENIFKGTQDPWAKLAENDVNGQMVQFKNPHSHFQKQREQWAAAQVNKA